MAVNGELDDEKARFIDWQSLRSRSHLPGGFGPSRTHIWPEILGVSVNERPETNLVEGEHRDEHQIRLDTDRSFVLYPVGSPAQDKEDMQEKLNNLLTSVFRRHPKLNYFQGYHDIVSVLFLTLPEEVQFACAEKISLHRVRDSMGSTLEPVLGLLRVSKNLLRLADPKYAQGLERSSQLPFYALSNILTLFSHDMPTLPLIQHVFDYLLCRPPIAVVYLATSVILSRKEAIQQLEDEDEDDGMGMSHSLLSGLPPMADELDVQVEEKEEKENAGGQQEVKIETNSVPLVKEEEDVKLSLDEKLSNLPVEDNKPESIPLPKDESSPSTSRPSTPFTRPPQAPPIPLTSLLTHADELYALYPPTHPELCLSSIMGPQSVVYTWSESFSALPTDTEAEAMVSCPNLIVYPYIEEDEIVEEGEGGDDDEDEWEEKPTLESGKRKTLRERLRFKMKGKRKHLRRPRMDQRTSMVAGAVLVLGIALAVYGMQKRENLAGLGLGASSGPGRDWRKVAGWVGGAVTGVTERVASGLSVPASNG